MQAMKMIGSLMLIGAMPLTLGCVQQVDGRVQSGKSLASIREFHIVRAEQTDATDAIQKDLVRRGFTVTMGPESATPATASCKILTTDHWTWDMTMYLLELKVEMVDPKTGELLASGRSYRTSLARKSPDQMAREVFDKIFGTVPSKGGSAGATPDTTASAGGS